MKIKSSKNITRQKRNLWRKKNVSLEEGYNYDALHVGKIDRLFRANILVHHGCRVWTPYVLLIPRNYRYSEVDLQALSRFARPSVHPSVHPSVCLVHLVVHTVNFKGVKDFQIPRCLLREHRHHLEEFLEADSFGDRRRVSWILASCKDFRDPFSKWIFLKIKEETNILIERKFKIKIYKMFD